ncbi:MAG: DUF503 domain-containing protein [Chloroflexota bacterium]|nr:DUF503 domain-containing protein [Chloroflexota bacterium]
MPTIRIALCTLELELSGVETLKDKRSVIKPLLKRLHDTFNVSTAEIDRHDIPDSSVIAFAIVTTATSHAHSSVSTILNWIEKHAPDAEIVDQTIEIV